MLKYFNFAIQVRRSIQFFLDNLLSQTPDQQQTLAAIGEVCTRTTQAELMRLIYELLFDRPNGTKLPFDVLDLDLFL